MECKNAFYKYAYKKIDSIFNELKDEEIGEYRAYDVAIGFIDGLYWAHILNDEKALDLGAYAFTRMLKTALEKDLRM